MTIATERSETGLAGSEPPSLVQILLAFTKIGATSFGGGVSGWMRLEFVQRRRWIAEDDFLIGLSLAQAMPGVNVANLAIWIGYELRRTPGAMVALAGVLVVPGLLIVALGQLIAVLGGYALTHVVLAGIAATAIGLSLSLGLIAARRKARKLVPIGFLLATMTGILAFHLSTVAIVLILGPLSIGYEYLRLRSRAEP